MGNKILALEGLPFAGKTTLARSLATEAEARGTASVVLNEFSQSEMGQLVARSVDENTYRAWPIAAQTFLFLADKCVTSQVAEGILSDNDSNAYTKIILDRSIFSVLAFQLTLQSAQDPNYDEIVNFSKSCKTISGHQLIFPAIVLFLDIPPSLCYDRGLSSSAFSLEELNRIRETYLLLAHHYGFKILDDTKSPDLVLSEAVRFLREINWL